MENVTLMQGDCLELMKEIPDGSVDMILCDLPYGTTQNKWDSVIPLKPLFSDYRRIIKTGGVIALFSQMPFSADLVNAYRKGFRYEWVWKKPQGTGFLNCNRMPMKAHENVLIFYDRLPLYNPQKEKRGGRTILNRHAPSGNYGKYHSVVTVNDGTRYPLDVVEFNMERGHHPTQKPVPLLEYLIKTYTNDGDLVLDNCMGSGSTGVACVNTGRRFIGIELDDNYFKIAEERINKASGERSEQITLL